MIRIPKYAKVIKGGWLDDGYGNVWCKIQQIQVENQDMSLVHPEYGGFAWVSMKNCEFSHTNRNRKKRKDGIYAYLNGKQALYAENLSLMEKEIESKIGKWSMKNADKWSSYLLVEYKGGYIVDECTF